MMNWKQSAVLTAAIISAPLLGGLPSVLMILNGTSWIFVAVYIVLVATGITIFSGKLIDKLKDKP